MSGVVHGLLASLAGVVRDTFFRYVSLLLNTNATNGAQNNTFLDGSTNAFSITRNGNTTQGNFSPFSQTGWSNFFDGTGDYLSVAHNAALNLTSGDFTIEAFVYWSGSNANSTIIDKDGVSGSSYPQYDISLNGSGFVVCYVGSGNGTSSIQSITSNTALPANTWAHLAFVKSGTTLTLYQNGTSVASATQTATMTDGAKAVLVGYQTGVASTYYFNGYISNLRIVKGTAVYTANFTPPTSPLTAITNTSLLTCQSNRFIDNSSNAFTITRNGDVAVQAFSPFAPTAAWSASTNGGSGYFDGTGDYLTAAMTALSFGTGNFTIEGWVYRLDTNTRGVFQLSSTAGGLQASTTNTLALGSDAGQVWRIYANGTAYNSTATWVTGVWYHFALVRNSGTTTLYINGTSVISQADTTNYTGVNIAVSGFYDTTFLMNGYISGVRVLTGTAQYTANFTPPTAPLTAITNTSLLLNFTNAGIYDSASGNDLETVGNAQVSTVQSKWGTTSMAFDGTGDEAVTIAKPRLVFGTAPFTVEMWVYCTNAASGATQDLVGNLTNVAGDTNWHFSISSTGVLQSGTYNNLLASSGAATLSSTTWTHVAFTFDGTTYRVFINGTVGTTTSTIVRNLSDSTSAIKVGHTNFGGRFFNGYIDDLRITNGYARYTANFTAPTAAFPLQ